MENSVFVKSYSLSEPDLNEILRYMGTKTKDDAICKVISEALSMVSDKLKPNICYIVLPYYEEGNFSFFKVSSKKLEENLKGCRRVILFAATIGSEIDRLILKYSKISPLMCLALQAIGAERIEALCDAFIDEMKKTFNLRARFSPGYGDFSLEYQREIFNILKPQGKIGLTLNSSLIMSPSKSVTAIAGISDELCEDKTGCINCEKKDCEFRRTL